MKKPSFHILLIFFTASFFIYSCTTQRGAEPINEATAIATTYPLEKPENASEIDYSNHGYPVTEDQQSPSSEYVEDLIIPTPETDSAVVLGQLIEQSTNKPYLAPGLYLGSLLNKDNTDSKVPSVISISTQEDPKAIQAKNGSFLFSDIPPGKYTLVIWTPMSLSVVKDLETSQDILFDVESGETLDLGIILIP